MLFTLLVVIGVALILFLLRPAIVILFEAEGIALTLIYLFCGPLALLFFFNGAIFVSNAAFNNLGRPLWSTWINWGRNTLGTVPFVIACGAIWGAPGVLIGQALGGVAFALIAAYLADRIMKDRQPLVETTPFARQGRQLSLLNLRR